MIGAVRWPRYQFQSWMEQRGTIYQVLITVVTRIEEVLKGIKDRSLIPGSGDLASATAIVRKIDLA